MIYSLDDLVVRIHWMDDEHKMSGWNDTRRNISKHSFYWIYGGSGSFLTEEGIQTFGPGTLLYLKPGLRMSMEAGSEGMDIIMTLTDLIQVTKKPETSLHWSADSLTESIHLPFLHRASPEHLLLWTQRLRNAHRCWVPGSQRGEFQTQAILLELIEEWHRMTTIEESGASESRKSYERIRQELELRYADDLKIRTLCELNHLSTSYVRKLFMRYLGESPKDYLIRIRTEHVKKCLLYTDMPLKAIATNCGFLDEFHLSRTFKRLNGIPPSEYRKVNRQ
ncbi:helix-turn-helix transcriptional regulator [Paenibacillus sp. GCM10027628]|uniref:helix-turn-helix transcriptional regulator n=1 Tax=Paenibacillus sp. GCM10027628 TaxID=3273413 RepID=UPI0036423484